MEFGGPSPTPSPLVHSPLQDAYEKNNIRNFERILRANPKEITEDAFLNQFIGAFVAVVVFTPPSQAYEQGAC
jgi:hypothetical protein